MLTKFFRQPVTADGRVKFLLVLPWNVPFKELVKMIPTKNY